MQCYTCFGSGRVTCPACQGQGSYWEVVGNRNVWEPCHQCGGGRIAPCQTCGGTGRLPDPPIPGRPRIDPGPPNPPPKLSPDPALLQLAGRWKGGGRRYEFARQNDGYRVTRFNIFGMKIGEGEAEANGSVLTLTVRTKLAGPMTADLQLSGDRLRGRTRGLIPLPFALRRA
jgi:hypothetical protein